MYNVSYTMSLFLQRSRGTPCIASQMDFGKKTAHGTSFQNCIIWFGGRSRLVVCIASSDFSLHNILLYHVSIHISLAFLMDNIDTWTIRIYV